MNILVISTHPDDETLGCGGTILKHKSNGDNVSWIIATSPHVPAWSEETVAGKLREVEAVSKAYGMDDVSRLEFPSAMLDTLPMNEVIRSLDSKISDVRPEIGYLVHGGDVHSDHQVISNAALAVLKPFKMGKFGVRKVLAYETLSSTDAAYQAPGSAFLPNVYMDISAFIDRKIAIMEIYESECQADPLPRGPSAIKALARFRGATIGAEYAEAFVLIREIG